MTTVSPTLVTLGMPLHTTAISDTAIALLDDRGTVVGWTQAAEQLVGHSTGDVVGRAAELVLPCFAGVPTTSDFVEQCRARNGWSGTTAVRHRDGRVLDVSLRISMLQGLDGTGRWLASLADAGTLSGEALGESVRGPLLDRAPIGVVIRDPQLRRTWTNDTIAGHDGIPNDRRLGHRLTDTLPTPEAEALQAVMRQVLQSGTTKVHE